MEVKYRGGWSRDKSPDCTGLSLTAANSNKNASNYKPRCASFDTWSTMRVHRLITISKYKSSPSRLASLTPHSPKSIRCASTALRPLRKYQLPLDRRWHGSRYRSGAAAAVYVSWVKNARRETNFNRLEQAAEPEKLAQETIISNLTPQESARLSRIRNIGIAVCTGFIATSVASNKI